MRFAPFYAAGAAMGWTPMQVDDCGLWQFQVAAVAWAEMHGAEREMSSDEASTAEAVFDAAPDTSE